jgi:hypothetical protein
MKNGLKQREQFQQEMAATTGNGCNNRKWLLEAQLSSILHIQIMEQDILTTYNITQVVSNSGFADEV